jgi:hypothetical protein
MNDEWIKKPEYESINIPDGNIKRKSKPFKEKINDLIQSGKNNPEKTLAQIKKLKERIKNFRQSGLDKSGEYSLENLAFKDLRNTGYLDKLSQLSQDLVSKQFSLNEGMMDTNIFERFMSYACNELQIQQPPSFEIKHEFGEEQPSFGAYVPSDHHIFINPSNRNIVDVLRTLAHELVHAKQNELGLLRPDSGETGSDHENDANSIAGILMRDYGKQNPDIYNIGMLNKAKDDWKKTSWENEKGEKVTLPQLLQVIKDYPIIQAPIEKVKKIIIKKNSGGIESDRVNKADFKYPIIIIVDNNDNYKYILDGNHRANKAIDAGLETIPAKLVNVDKLSKKFQSVLGESLKDIKGTPIYHFTSESNGLKIISSNTLLGTKPDDEYLSLDKKLANTKNQKTISFTRDKNFKPDSSIGKGTGSSIINNDIIIFVLDKDKLKTKYKVESFNYSSVVEPNYQHTNKHPELEERVLADKINPLQPYIIDIIYKGNNIETKRIIKDYLNNIGILNEVKEEKQKITRIYFDLDGVLAGFDNQFRKYNKEGLDFKEYIGKYGSSKAWDIINKGGTKYWSEMDWNPGGKALYNYVTKIANKNKIELWVLSSPGLDPNGDATKGKNEWVDKHLNIPLNRRVYKQAKHKHTEAKPGYLLIDDMGKNVAEFIEAGGLGIKNNPENSIDSIKKLSKFNL